jgi:hypothetical protein
MGRIVDHPVDRPRFSCRRNRAVEEERGIKMNAVSLDKWLDIGAAVFALAAAVFWFLSAYGRLPPLIA